MWHWQREGGQKFTLFDRRPVAQRKSLPRKAEVCAFQVDEQCGPGCTTHSTPATAGHQRPTTMTAQLMLITPGVIADRLGQPLHRVEYVISARRIAPIARAGGIRVFSEQAVARIANELRRIDEDRGAMPTAR